MKLNSSSGSLKYIIHPDFHLPLLEMTVTFVCTKRDTLRVLNHRCGMTFQDHFILVSTSGNISGNQTVFVHSRNVAGFSGKTVYALWHTQLEAGTVLEFPGFLYRNIRYRQDLP